MIGIPRLQERGQIVGDNGRPSRSFVIAFNDIIAAIEKALVSQQEQIDAINAAMAAAQAAQATADSARTEALEAVELAADANFAIAQISTQIDGIEGRVKDLENPTP